jgi:hypothetical protein
MNNFIDDPIIGHKYGKWTIVAEGVHKHKKKAKFFKCICDCGVTKEVDKYGLVRGTSTSCGCSSVEKRRDSRKRTDIVDRTSLVGLKFGMLTVTGVTLNTKRKDSCLYDCICDCGNTISSVTFSNLTHKVKSCGCGSTHSEFIAISTDPQERLAIGDIYKSYIKGAKARSLEFSISPEKFYLLLKSDCYYCGGFSPRTHTKKKYPKYVGNLSGIDRINSNEGYTNTNVVSCCTQCNYAKRSYTNSEFLSWVYSVATKLKLSRLQYPTGFLNSIISKLSYKEEVITNSRYTS